jgi:hypothetical protein
MFLQRSLTRGHGGTGGLALILAAILFMGCQPEPEIIDEPYLNGVWINNSGGYVTTIKIDTSKNTIEYVDSYEGKIVNSPHYDAINGVLIIEFTKYCDFMDHPPKNDHSSVGKFGAMYWKDLSSKQVFLSDAYTGFTHTMFNTLKEAEENFTLDNAGNYIDWSYVGPYTP